jgi:hypothetical protein
VSTKLKRHAILPCVITAIFSSVTGRRGISSLLYIGFFVAARRHAADVSQIRPLLNVEEPKQKKIREMREMMRNTADFFRRKASSFRYSPPFQIGLSKHEFPCFMSVSGFVDSNDTDEEQLSRLTG